MQSHDANKLDAALADIQSLATAGDFARAVPLCEKLCDAHGKDARPWFLLGAMYGQTGNDARAEACSRRSLALNPGLVGAHHNLATVLIRQHRCPEAEAVLRQALSLSPTQAVLHNELGNALRCQGKVDAAITALRKAVELAPGFRDAQFGLGELLLEIGDMDGGLACMRACYASDNSFVQAKAMEALILERQGLANAAYQCLEPLLQRPVVLPVVANAFAAVSTHLGKEQEAITCLKQTIAAAQAVDERYSSLHMQLGHLQNRLGQYEEAFEHYVQANQLAGLPDNGEQFVQSMRDTAQRFTKPAVAEMPHVTAGGEGLVFIVGMPRSGTTLIEQILAAHSGVKAGGELPFLGQVAKELLPLLRRDNAGGAVQGEDLVKRYADQYADLLRRHVGSAERVTDKTPHNFEYLGLVEIMFPGARVIHCTRNPLDTCVSCYCHQFAGENLAYTNDQESLGHVYGQYRELMTHWGGTLTLPVLEVPYESVVADTETWIGKILSFCDLPWEEQCLEFHRVKRQVSTASYNQVRQPVYRGSVNRWKHYDRQLDPLRSALGQWSETAGND